MEVLHNGGAEFHPTLPKWKAGTENPTQLCGIPIRDQPLKYNRLLHVANTSSNIYLVDIMNELVHLSEPWVSILVREICPHSPHDMIGASDVALKEES